LTIEETRRQILGVPADYRGDSFEYLDWLAITRMQEVTDMAAAAPTPLARALIFSGKTRGELAEAIGVSVTAVGHWASGEKPLPASRLVEIALFLGVKPSDLRDEGRPAPDSDELSYFGWLVEHVIMSGYYGPPRHEIALALGVTLAKLRAYTHGVEEIPEAIVTALARAYLPNMEGRLK
jgi:DNA-binding transcriptional regulator YdaS (Cro superfamily)